MSAPPFDAAAAMADFTAAGTRLRGAAARPAEPPHRRTHQRVLRRSQMAGHERYEPLSEREARRRARAVEMYMVKTQKAGVRSGAAVSPIEGRPPLSYFDVQLYRLLCNAAVRFAGRVEPSYAWMAQRMTGVATRTKQVVAAVKRLEAHGLVRKQRRYVEAAGAGHRRGPQVEQTTNFYWVLPLPTAARKLMDSFLRRRRGPPGDAADEARAAEGEAQAARWARDEAWAEGRRRSPALARGDARAAAELGVFVEELPDAAARSREKQERDVP